MTSDPLARPYKAIYPSKASHKQVTEFLSDLNSEDKKGIMDEFVELEKNPRHDGCIKLGTPVKLASYVAQYRVITGHFRIFYDIEDNLKKVYVFGLRRRNEKTYR